MESLDLLEQRINALLGQVSSLRDENKTLRFENEQGLNALAEENKIMAEENRVLKDALTQETKCKEAVSGRIDGIIERLKTQLGED